MIDNMEAIRPLLQFRSKDDFYIASVIKRKKENHELGNNSYVAKSYVLPSVEALDFYYGEMKALCNHHNARTYINLNRRSFKKVAFEMNKKIALLIEGPDYTGLKNLYSSTCSKWTSEKEKKWLVDIDDIEGRMHYVVDVCMDIDRECAPEGKKVLALIPTKSGMHIITKPFHLEQFKKIYPGIDVKKNSPTLLMAF